MRNAGAVAVSDDGDWLADGDVLRRAMQHAALFGMPVVQHAEDTSLSRRAPMHEGAVSTRLGLAGQTDVAEAAAVARDLLIAGLAGGRLHLAHISTALAVGSVREAKARGSSVTCEVTPHHLTLTDDEVARSGYSTRFKMNPPLRERADVASLVDALVDGTIDAIATDHAPHHVDEKEVEFDAAPFGVVGLETAAAVVFDRLVASGPPLPGALRRALLGRTRARLRPARRHARAGVARRRHPVRSRAALDRRPEPVRLPRPFDPFRGLGARRERPRPRSSRGGSSGGGNRIDPVALPRGDLRPLLPGPRSPAGPPRGDRASRGLGDSGARALDARSPDGRGSRSGRPAKGSSSGRSGRSCGWPRRRSPRRSETASRSFRCRSSRPVSPSTAGAIATPPTESSSPTRTPARRRSSSRTPATARFASCGACSGRTAVQPAGSARCRESSPRRGGSGAPPAAG